MAIMACMNDQIAIDGHDISQYVSDWTLVNRAGKARTLELTLIVHDGDEITINGKTIEEMLALKAHV